jgi:competence protein ComEA
MSEIPPRPAPPRRLADIVQQWVQWYGIARLAITAGSVLAVVVGALLLLRPSAAPVEATLPVAASTPPTDLAQQATTATTSPTAVVVHVAGAVAAPGVYTLPPGARVADALAAAGGPTAIAEPDAVNLAAMAVDGSRIYVPEVGEAVPADVTQTGGQEPIAVGPIDVNMATVAQLDTLPGIGPATAAAIVAHREQHGPFGSVEDLADVRGIGPSKLDALRAMVRV